jgi:CRISPR-associated protein Cas1
VTVEDAETARESQAEVDTVLSETGATMDKVRRWRREGLLSREIDWRPGSVVRYPRGTCTQIRAITALFKEKNRVKYVGLRLWCQGFPVDEKYWRPQLQKSGRWLDRWLPLLMRLIDRFNRDFESETFYDRTARDVVKADDIVLSRVKGRTNAESLPIVLRVLSEVGTGAFQDFEAPRRSDEDGNVWRPADETAVIGALDLVNAGSHSILEKKLNLIELLPSGLGHLSIAMSMGNFARAADAPAEEIARAREDARNGVAIGFYLYEATRWIYGDGAFGLRLAAWIARKAPNALVDSMTLLMLRLRQVPDAILPSEKIAEMAKQARKVCLFSKRHEWYWRNDPRFSKILDPKRIKLVFADEIALKRWHSELNAIILQATAKARWVPVMTVKRSAKVIKLQAPLRCAEPTPADMELEQDDLAWAARSGMWQSRVEKASARRTKRAKAQPALILAGYGVSLRVENGALTIQNGFTHYPQKHEINRYFRGDVALPERIILLDGSGSISFDVLSWLAEQNVSLIRIDWKGDIVCVAGASGYSANPFRVRRQLETRENAEQRNEFCRSIITQKIEATIITLEKSIPRSDKWERAMRSAYAALSRLEENPPENMSGLRTLEANCAASYFRSWVGMPIKWRGTSRRPIPDNWLSVGARSSPYHLAGNRDAAHPVNAILNYAYAALESKIRIRAISEGYDPTIGIMHEGSDGSSKFIFDLMEPERPKADRTVLEFVKGHVFNPADFVIRTDGVCRLNPEMARLILVTAGAVIV